MICRHDTVSYTTTYFEIICWHDNTFYRTTRSGIICRHDNTFQNIFLMTTHSKLMCDNASCWRMHFMSLWLSYREAILLWRMQGSHSPRRMHSVSLWLSYRRIVSWGRTPFPRHCIPYDIAWCRRMHSVSLWLSYRRMASLTRRCIPRWLVS